LWTISNPQGEASRLTNDLSDYDLAIALTGDGKTLAATVSTQLSNIWEAPSAQVGAARQITFGETPMLHPIENVDGKIMWQSSDGELWSMKADGTQRESFVEQHTVIWFQPCGHQVLFASFENGQLVLMRVNSDGTKLATLFSGDFWLPTCSPDGSLVYYFNFVGPEKMWRMPITGGTPETLSDVPGEVAIDRLNVSPDGQFLAYVYATATPPALSLAVVPAEGGPPVHHFMVPAKTSGMQWSPNGEGLQYLRTHDGVTNIWEQPLAGGKPRQLTTFRSGQIFDFSWSADHKRLFFTRGSVSSDVVLIRNLR